MEIPHQDPPMNRRRKDHFEALGPVRGGRPRKSAGDWRSLLQAVKVPLTKGNVEASTLCGGFIHATYNFILVRDGVLKSFYRHISTSSPGQIVVQLMLSHGNAGQRSQHSQTQKSQKHRTQGCHIRIQNSRSPVPW